MIFRTICTRLDKKRDDGGGGGIEGRHWDGGLSRLQFCSNANEVDLRPEMDNHGSYADRLMVERFYDSIFSKHIYCFNGGRIYAA